MARPTKYSEEILTQTQEYLDLCNDGWKMEARKKVKTNALGQDELVDALDVRYKVKLPTLEGLAYYLKVNKDTIQEWKKIHPEFSVLIADLLAKQAEALVNYGLSGDYNPTIAKVLLTKHGYTDKTETDITSNGEGITPILVKFLNGTEPKPNAESDNNRDTRGVSETV